MEKVEVRRLGEWVYVRHAAQSAGGVGVVQKVRLPASQATQDSPSGRPLSGGQALGGRGARAIKKMVMGVSTGHRGIANIVGSGYSAKLTAQPHGQSSGLSLPSAGRGGLASPAALTASATQGAASPAGSAGQAPAYITIVIGYKDPVNIKVPSNITSVKILQASKAGQASPSAPQSARGGQRSSVVGGIIAHGTSWEGVRQFMSKLEEIKPARKDKYKSKGISIPS